MIHKTNNQISWQDEFVEKGADLEHDRWARWQKWVFECSEKLENGSVVIPPDLVERWEDQIKTPYKDLSEKEKESDRKETRNYLPFIASLLQKQREEIEKENWEFMHELQIELLKIYEVVKNSKVANKQKLK